MYGVPTLKSLFQSFSRSIFEVNKVRNATVTKFRLCSPRAYYSFVTALPKQNAFNERMEVGPYFINYIKVGHGPHVVFCYPGILGSYRVQLPNQILGFDREQFTFITWDQPGYGQSRPPERVFTDDSLAEDADYLKKFMKGLGYKKYSVMGWSGGGNSALLFAIKYPHIINKLVVWGAFSYVDKADAEIFKWFSNTDGWGGKMKEVLVDEYGEPFFKEHFAMWMDLFCRIHFARKNELCSKAIHKISAPTLVIHGTEDNLVKMKHGEFLRDNIPNARLERWDKGKHNMHLRYPERFNQIVQQFLLE
ncbi:unnamed protein product [Orchesella dallaii]|uniref:AB hydrolase-1 domain-containing protein n=1 Tax=Orchesella dallaii TaxID=48710 RepID=A0ABP1PJZ2_9HEXA